MSIEKITEKAKEAKSILREMNELSSAIKKREDELQEELKNDKEKLALLKLQFDATNADICELGKAYFKETTNKNLVGGYKIQERKKIEYDETKALAWAKEKDMFLSLDKKSFEKAVEGLSLDFVTISKEPSLAIPKEIVID